MVGRSRFFFNDTATTEIYTLSLHDALPICRRRALRRHSAAPLRTGDHGIARRERPAPQEHDADEERHEDEQRNDQRQQRSEEHTSELQSRQYLVCRLLLEKTTIARFSS